MTLSNLAMLVWISAHCSVVHSARPVPSGLHKEEHGAVIPVKLLHQYPEDTWIENIAIRESGELLLTILNLPRLEQLDPFELDTKPYTVFSPPNAQSLAGIAEISPDTFAVAVGNFSLSEGSIPGSWSTWKVAFEDGNSSPAATKITDLPELAFPNGMCVLPDTTLPHPILNGDIDTGKIWRIDTETGAHEVVIDNNLTAVAPNPIFGKVGVNGLHVREGVLYFVNSGQEILARIPITPDGMPLKAPEVVARFNAPLQFDDFAIKDGVGYLVTGTGDSVAKIRLNDRSPHPVIIAGTVNSTQIAEPTSAAFGRTRGDKHILYVVTAGGLAAPVNQETPVVGAQVLAIDTRSMAW